MNEKIITIIVATDLNHTIGGNNSLLWHLPNDLKRFKKLTSNNTIIMGRKTYESIGSKPLPNRQNIIISNTTNLNLTIENTILSNSLEDAIKKATSNNIFIIGGGQIYKEALNKNIGIFIELTSVHTQKKGDTYFPKIDPNQWEEIKKEINKKDSLHKYDYDFITYRKKI